MNLNQLLHFSDSLPVGQAPTDKTIELDQIGVNVDIPVDDADVRKYVERLQSGQSTPRLVVFYSGIHFHLGGGFALHKALKQLKREHADVSLYQGNFLAAHAYATELVARRAAGDKSPIFVPVTKQESSAVVTTAAQVPVPAAPRPTSVAPVQVEPAKPVKKVVFLSHIRIDGRTQAREHIDIDTVTEYAEAMEAGAVFPPLILYFDGANHWLADGFHRLHAATKAKIASLDAVVHQGTVRDAQLFAFGANASHGLRRSNTDKRRAIEAMLADAEWGKWSDNLIAKKCGVSQSTVSRSRPSLMHCISDQPQERIYTTRHGSQTVMNTGAIGKAQQQVTQPIHPPTPVAQPPEFNHSFNSGSPEWDGVPLNSSDGDLNAEPPQPAAHAAPAQAPSLAITPEVNQSTNADPARDSDLDDEFWFDDDLTEGQKAENMAAIEQQEALKKAKLESFNNLLATDDHLAAAAAEITRLNEQNVRDRMSLMRMEGKARSLCEERDRLGSRLKRLERNIKELEAKAAELTRRLEAVGGDANV